MSVITDDYVANVEVISKRCFVELKDGEKVPVTHSKTLITLTHREGAEVCFTITQKGNKYDSRDGRTKKKLTPEFVQSELNRMLGQEAGQAVWQEAQVVRI